MAKQDGKTINPLRSTYLDEMKHPKLIPLNGEAPINDLVFPGSRGNKASLINKSNLKKMGEFVKTPIKPYKKQIG